MTQRVFIKVLGFTDVERHALNTVFRLSEQRETAYSLWVAEAPEAPHLALIDGQSYEARLELESPGNAGLGLIWVGADAPANIWRAFERPISWPDVVKAMDDLFAPPEALDFDIDFDSSAADTQPPDTEPPDTEPPDTLPPDTLPPDDAFHAGPPVKRALIASPDRDERLYMRAKLSLAQLTQADEAETGAQALELMRSNTYAVALVDFGLPDINGWAFLKELNAARPAIPHVIITTHRPSLPQRMRAWLAGAEGIFDKPPDPGKLQELLEKV